MAQFESLNPTTELEAVNIMLGWINLGEITQSELDSPSLPNVKMAVRLMKENIRAVLAKGWRFNTEFGYELAPTSGSPVTVTLSDGDTVDLNVFTKPDELLEWDMTPTWGQLREDIDLVLRPPRNSDIATEAGNKLVFYDREQNRGGLDSSVEAFSHLYINPIWRWDFEDTPQSFRSYVTIRAGRQLIKQAVGDVEGIQVSRKDELEALTLLRQRHGDVDENANFFESGEMMAKLGHRHRRIRRTQRISRRDNPGLS